MKGFKRKFKVTGKCFNPIQKKMVQKFLDKNQDEVEDKAKQDIAEYGEVRLTVEQVEKTRSRSIYELVNEKELYQKIKAFIQKE